MVGCGVGVGVVGACWLWIGLNANWLCCNALAGITCTFPIPGIFWTGILCRFGIEVMFGTWIIFAPGRIVCPKFKLLAGITVYCCPPAPVNVIGWPPACKRLTGVAFCALLASGLVILFADTDWTVIEGVEAAETNRGLVLTFYDVFLQRYYLMWKIEKRLTRLLVPSRSVVAQQTRVELAGFGR